MSTIADPNSGGFKLSQLLYDKRYRSTTIQIIALIGILCFFAWLVVNTMNNLATLGQDVNFKYLTEPAGYDINQRLLDYQSRDTHLRASFLGLLNTLLVAFLGCVTATIIGVFVGVLRLSNNWIVARIMTFYIEMFRNIPVLLWILIVFTVMITAFPLPKDFRNGEAVMSLWDSVALTNRGVYIPEPLFNNSLGNFHLFGDALQHGGNASL